MTQEAEMQNGMAFKPGFMELALDRQIVRFLWILGHPFIALLGDNGLGVI